MTLSEIKLQAKGLCTKCRVCPECNGLACKGQIPGMGGKKSGASFIRNVERLKKIKVVMDVIAENKPVTTGTQIFGKQVSLPVYIAPMAGINNNFGADLSDDVYTEYTLNGAAEAGTIAFTGDGVNTDMFFGPIDVIDSLGGVGIPTIKPWAIEGIKERLDYMKQKNVLALATDIDSAGLPLLRSSAVPVENKSTEALKQLKESCGVPLIIKGIMSVAGAKKALAAGADAIVVSNHGGRVQDHTLATIEVLQDIAQAVGDKMTILVDGGFRTGIDVFKALALGAHGVLIGRPIGIAAIGGGEQGVRMALDKIKSELMQTMMMTGCSEVSEIDNSKIVFVD